MGECHSNSRKQLGFFSSENERAEYSCRLKIISKKDLSATNLLPKESLVTDDVLEHVTTHVHVDGAEWVVKEVDIGVLIHGSSQADSQLLTAAQTDALRERNINTLIHGSSQTRSF